MGILPYLDHKYDIADKKCIRRVYNALKCYYVVKQKDKNEMIFMHFSYEKRPI